MSPQFARHARPITTASHLWSKERVATLRDTGLMGGGRQERLEKLCASVALLVDVPVVQITVVSDEHQYYVAGYGMDETVQGPVDLHHSVCKHVVDLGTPLGIDDALEDPVLCENLAVKEWRVRSYLGEPLVAPDGDILGSLCVVDYVVRSWTNRDMEVLKGMARMVTAVVLAAADPPG